MLASAALSLTQTQLLPLSLSHQRALHHLLRVFFLLSHSLVPLSHLVKRTKPSQVAAEGRHNFPNLLRRQKLPKDSMFVPTGYGGVISPRDPQVSRKRRYNVTFSPAGGGGSDIASGEGPMIGPGGGGRGVRGGPILDRGGLHLDRVGSWCTRYHKWW